MNARFIAASCGMLLAAVGFTAGAQTIEITSASLGTVMVRPETIDKRGSAVAAQRAARGDPRSSGVDLGIRRKADGSLYDALDPRQNPAAASPLQDDVATAAITPVERDGAVTAARGGSGNGNRRNGVAQRASPADFPYGVNGVAR